MSAGKVDVLAVMAQAKKVLDTAGLQTMSARNAASFDLDEARAAVAELIEAASAHVGDDEGATARRLRAALARVQS